MPIKVMQLLNVAVSLGVLVAMILVLYDLTTAIGLNGPVLRRLRLVMWAGVVGITWYLLAFAEALLDFLPGTQFEDALQLYAWAPRLLLLGALLRFGAMFRAPRRGKKPWLIQ